MNPASGEVKAATPDFSIAVTHPRATVGVSPRPGPMKIVFRVNYRTVPGESLWLGFAASGAAESAPNRWLPMRWIDDWHWEVVIDPSREAGLPDHYAYQLREEGGVVLDEWGEPRRLPPAPEGVGLLLIHDTWRCAGTIDHVYETKAFDRIFPPRSIPSRGAAAPPRPPHHVFRLHMSGVPEGLVPCVSGDALSLGAWEPSRAVPLEPVAPNEWVVAVDLDPRDAVEYKYGLHDPRLGRAVSLEDGENRRLKPHSLAATQHTVVSDEGYRRDPAATFRGAGVAIPVFSLRTEAGLGIGEFADLKPLADWAAEVGLKLIQILPVNDTTAARDWTDSYPYSAISAFALHPAYLRLQDLPYPMPAAFDRELSEARRELNALDHVDHAAVMEVKTRLTRGIFDAHRDAITASAGFRRFFDRHRFWLTPYAAFCVLRDALGTADFSTWGEWARYDPARVTAMADPQHPQWIDFCYPIWLQYELDRQFTDAVDHLHRRGLVLKGDLPIGVDRHSADAWSCPHLFKFGSQAGAPPDAFATRGQNWGFPTYDWQAMAADGFAWWRARFERLTDYFDAYRIDHILGFFRIWQVPVAQLEGILGSFDPSLPLHRDEVRARGITVDPLAGCRPRIRRDQIAEWFGEAADDAMEQCLDPDGPEHFRPKPHLATQRAVEIHFAALKAAAPAATARPDLLCHGMIACLSEVLFLEVPGSAGTLFHPRWALRQTRRFGELDVCQQQALDALEADYFHHRQESLWRACGQRTLQAMRRASRMLLCGEDLGVVPACVPPVLRRLGILSLEIQRMPKSAATRFADPAAAPHLSVVSPSTHDMPTLRAWWREDPQRTADFAWQGLGLDFPPLDLSGELATRLLHQHLESPAMWAVFLWQDLLAVDETLRHPDPAAERINDPAIMPYHWRYRMHLDLADLAAAGDFNRRIARLLEITGRAPARPRRGGVTRSPAGAAELEPTMP